MRRTGTSVGDVAMYACDEQYSLVGSENVKCLSTGKWDKLPFCEKSMPYIKVARARTRRKNTFPIHTFKTLIYRSN